MIVVCFVELLFLVNKYNQMKDKLTLLLIFFSINVFGQQVLFKNELVDTILIRSHRNAF